MAKLTLNSIGSRYGSIDSLNDNFDAIEQAIENTLSRDGTSPNAMEADLDMNSYDILNAGEVNTTSLRINGVLVEPDIGVTVGVAFQTYQFTATEGQTIFSVAPAIPFNSSIVVIVNGLQLSANETSVSTTNVITPALTAGDEVVIRRYTAIIEEGQGNIQLSLPATSGPSSTVTLGSSTATTVGAAGGASSLPATPLGYLIGYVGGVQVKFPYYTA